MQTKRGEFADLVVDAGQSELVQGAVDGARVEVGAGLTVQGALAGAVHVDGALMAQGAIAGAIAISPGGVAVLQGVIAAQIRNEGIVVVDAHPVGSTVDLVNLGEGRSTTVDDLPPELRRKLPTVTSSASQS